MSASKRKQTSLRIDQKLKILDCLQSKGKTRRELSVQYGCDLSTIARIAQQEQKIRIVALGSGNAARKRLRNGNYRELDQAVSIWFWQMRAENVVISGPMIMEEAKKFAQTLGIPHFKPNNGWLERWKKKENVTFHKNKQEDATDPPLHLSHSDPSPFDSNVTKEFHVKQEELNETSTNTTSPIPSPFNSNVTKGIHVKHEELDETRTNTTSSPVVVRLPSLTVPSMQPQESTETITTDIFEVECDPPGFPAVEPEGKSVQEEILLSIRSILQELKLMRETMGQLKEEEIALKREELALRREELAIRREELALSRLRSS